jgi:hypothetical protein
MPWGNSPTLRTSIRSSKTEENLAPRFGGNGQAIHAHDVALRDVAEEMQRAIEPSRRLADHGIEAQGRLRA